MKRALAVFAVLATLLCGQSYQPGEANRQSRTWFQDARFGLFIHWGVYSVLGNGEWVMNNQKIPIAEYEKLPAKFNPTEFNAAEWVSMAKNAGMKYITITSKHHDGFAMFATKQNKWNIVDATPCGQDPLKMLADECRGRASSSSSTIRSWTGITRITTRWGGPDTPRAARRAAISTGTSISWMPSCGNC